MSRREAMRLAGLGAAGLATDRVAERAFSAGTDGLPQFGQAKSCILLFLFGAPPQHETFDPKPLASAEI